MGGQGHTLAVPCGIKNRVYWGEPYKQRSGVCTIFRPHCPTEKGTRLDKTVLNT
jgi:hypothetical protein